MKESKVIDTKYLPAKLPVNLTILTYLLLDKADASQLIWGIMYAVFTFYWILAIWVKYTQKSVHPNELPYK